LIKYTKSNPKNSEYGSSYGNIDGVNVGNPSPRIYEEDVHKITAT
jgi:hypothetical protein